jgi:hypothetical protein
VYKTLARRSLLAQAEVDQRDRDVLTVETKQG